MEIRPPMLPNMTFIPRVGDTDVSEFNRRTRLFETLDHSMKSHLSDISFTRLVDIDQETERARFIRLWDCLTNSGRAR